MKSISNVHDTAKELEAAGFLTLNHLTDLSDWLILLSREELKGLAKDRRISIGSNTVGFPVQNQSPHLS
jgi:hypothetical protein